MSTNNPPTSPINALKVARGESIKKSASREATPNPPKPAGKSDSELITAFKSDLTNIRSLVTCSICDQLLYEPWILGCGHTYCYSCLCQWFVPNKRKKTCPECRTKVKQIPAPNFLVKQMVEIFTQRIELMPADESVNQHNSKRAEEVAAVEADKNSPTGLFKGVFPDRIKELWMDEADGVLRCPNCGHEHEGGPTCQVCGAEVAEGDPGEFSDMTDDDLDIDELDEFDEGLESELEAELNMHPAYYLGGDRHNHNHHHHFVLHQQIHQNHHRHAVDLLDIDADVSNNSDGSEADSDDEDAGSLQNFVVDDDEEPLPPVRRNGQARPSQTITISDDDDSDEGGAVSQRRSRRRRTAIGSSSPIITLTDTSVTGSEAGDMNSEAELLRTAGWSPLDQGNDSDAESPVAYPPYEYNSGYGFSEGDHDSDDDSDTGTETMVGNGGSGTDYGDDADDDRSREGLSETPTYRPGGFYSSGPRNYADEHVDDNSSEAGFSSIMDGDGDTEMSVSPRAYRRSLTQTPPAAGYQYQGRMSRPSREPSVGTNYDEGYPTSESRETSLGAEHAYGEMAQDLGVANEVHHDVGDGSSDSSIRPPARRLPRRQYRNERGQQTDPRISMIFAEHQQSLRGTQNNPIGLDLEDYEGEVRRIVEHGSGRNRRSTAYRAMPARRVDPLRSSRSPSATRVISSSDRTSRNGRRNDQRRP